MGLVLIHHQLDGTADHHAAQFFLGGVGGLHGAHVAALAQHGHPIGDLHDLVQLMGNKQDALALPGQAPHDLHQFFDLLRGQHGGRLVEDQHLIVAVEHLKNFYALLHSHGDVLDLGVQIHLQAVAFGQLLHLFAGRLFLQEAHFGVLRSEDDVVQYGEHVDQLEMLVHHADVQSGSVVGVVDLHLYAVFFDDAFFRLIQAEQDAHQRRFARSVFSQQSMDLALFQLQRHIIIGFNARKFLGDVQHFDDVIGRIVHRHAPFL
jgi:hypothetical protein